MKQIDHTAALRYALGVQSTTSSGTAANLARAYIAMARERDEVRKQLLRLLKQIDAVLAR